MSGTDTAIAELNEPAAEPDVAPAARARGPAVPDRRRCRATPSPGTSTRSAPSSSASRIDDGRRAHRPCRAGARRRRALPGRRVSRDRPESACTADAVSVSLMLHVADTDTALDRARERGRRVQRETYENYGSRNATIIDPFGHRWMLSGPVDRCGHPDPARRRGLCVGVDARRRPRRGVLRPRARAGPTIRTPTR